MSQKEGAFSRRRIVARMARMSGITNQQASDCLDALISVVQESLNSIGQISIRGLGIFLLVQGKIRKGYNFQTKGTDVFKQKRVIKFKPSSLLEKRCPENKQN